ncbi:MAG: HNH/ENDO VII family nuclease [Spirochaetaceae bacterium]|nr:HNH/ENDO VII family nuclease [Spirochaetaceae bacterium]
MVKKYFLIFVIILVDSWVCFGQDTTTVDDTTHYIEESTTYLEDISKHEESSSKYIESLTKHIEDFTYYQFGEIVDDVYVVRLQTQDYINSHTHIIIGTQYDLDVSKIFKNFLIGSGAILITILVMPALAPTIATNYIAMIVTSTAKAAVLQGAIAGVVTYIETGGDTEATLNSALVGASEGYKYAAVVASGAALASGIRMATTSGKLALDTSKDLRRPYIRDEVRREIELRAPKTRDRRFIDPNTGRPINGPYDLGHRPGHEFWREKAKAIKDGLTQEKFNDRMNNPDLYQIEDPSVNRGHKFEMPRME